MRPRVRTPSQLISQVRTTLRTRRLLPPGCRPLLAVSGGQDSLTLCDALLHLNNSQSPPPWPALALAHCDHRWPLDAGAAAHVAAYARARGLPLHVAAADPPPAPTEAAARHWRYSQLARLARGRSFSHVVTGHTASDLAETVVYNLAAGAGADGLASMTWRRGLCDGVILVRPLLDVRREETARFCAERALAVWRDPYNEDARFARNRVRGEVMPMLRAALNGRVEEALARTAHLLRDEADVVRAEAERVYGAAVWVGRGRVWVDREALKGVAVAVQRRVIRKALEGAGAGGHAAKVYSAVEMVVGLMEGGTEGERRSVGGGGEAFVADQRYIVIRGGGKREVATVHGADVREQEVSVVMARDGDG